MKHLFISLTIVSSLSAQDFIQHDKVQHVAAGLIVYGGCIVLGEILKKQDVTDAVNSKTCVLASIGVGVAKEIADRYSDNHVSDFNDVTATAIAPLLISYSIEF